MPHWTAIVLTCPNQNSAVAYQKELSLRQEKNLISKECLVLSIEDPDSPIGSGGATLNALNIVAEALSARNKYKMTQIELIKDNYILIMHMGRCYPFDVIGKAFASLPFQDDHYNLQTNFDLLYKMLTFQIAGLDKDEPHSDPGVYVCSTDIIFTMPKYETIAIKNSPVCVISTLADKEACQKNGIYILDKNNEMVERIYFNPDDEIFEKYNSNNDQFNLISGFVYLNFEVASTLYSLLLYAPIEACSYVGIDNGASPISLSLFFDILLAICTGIQKDEYLKGSFKSNHSVPINQKSILKQARSVLWETLHSDIFKIKNITIENARSVYMDNESFQHRIQIFQSSKELTENDTSLSDFTLNSNNSSILELNSSVSCHDFINTENSPVMFINSKVSAETSLKIQGSSVSILNCQFQDSYITIGNNCHLNDLDLIQKNNFKIPSNIFIQNIPIDLHCLKKEVNLSVVFGVTDELNKIFSECQWTIMNQSWMEFSALTSIVESDLWSDEIAPRSRCLMNAKLYPVVNLYLEEDEMIEMRDFCWINLLDSNEKNLMVKKWRQSMRLSIEEVLDLKKLEKIFAKRRFITNSVRSEMLVKQVIASKSIRFDALIRNIVHDGYSNEILESFDRAALENSDDLMLLPRIMSFISITLSEMAQEFGTLRAGASLNSNWMESFELIEKQKNREALLKLTKLRNFWLNRNDLLIRASRHYEGAMLAFIRQATSNFQSNTNEQNRIILEPIDTKTRKFEWIEVNCPARLDFAGGWSDTPPITYECVGGSCVTNVSILVNGKKPIGARGRIVHTSDKPFFIKVIMQDSREGGDQACFEFKELAELYDYNKPRAVACLMKAVFIFTKLIELNGQVGSLNEQLNSKLNGSLELHTWTGLPQGSGLGTSSILICCVLKVVWYLMGVNVSNETLAYSVLIVEQLMTTNGGWQDQVGGIYGGFKLTSAKNSLPLEISVKSLNVSADFLNAVDGRLLLIYTGLTRLAKDLLLNVLRNWYTISTKIYKNVHDLVENSRRCSEALETGNLKEVGECISNYRKQKLVMAPGSEPETVCELITKLEPYVFGMALAGAGGGGFLYALTKEADSKSKIQELLNASNLNMKIYDAQVSTDGIEFCFS